MSIKIKRGSGIPQANNDDLEDRQLGIDGNTGELYLRNHGDIIDIGGPLKKSETEVAHTASKAIGGIAASQTFPAGTTLDEFIAALLGDAAEPPITDIEITNIEITNKSIVSDITMGHENVTLTIEITPDTATNKDVTWESTDPTTISVVNGVVTFLKAGTATIKVTTNNDLYDEVTITVKEAITNVPLVGLTITNDETELDVEDTLQLNVEFNPTDATNKIVTWESNDENIATVSETGLVTGVGEGNVAITVKQDSIQDTIDLEINSVFVPVYGTIATLENSPEAKLAYQTDKTAKDEIITVYQSVSADGETVSQPISLEILGKNESFFIPIEHLPDSSGNTPNNDSRPVFRFDFPEGWLTPTFSMFNVLDNTWTSFPMNLRTGINISHGGKEYTQYYANTNKQPSASVIKITF